LEKNIIGCLKEYSKAMMFTFGTGVGFAMFIEENDKIYFQDNDTRDFLDHYTASFEKSLTALRTLKKAYAYEINNNEITRMKIFEDIKNGNKSAKELLEQYINNNCIGIERLYKLTKIDTFCIGGGLSEHGDLFIDMIRDKLPNLNILLAQNQNDAGLIGATELQNINKKRFRFEVTENLNKV